MMVRWMTLFAVMAFLRSTQAENLEGELRDKEEEGAVLETGSRVGQEMEAWWCTQQCAQTLRRNLVTTKGFLR